MEGNQNGDPLRFKTILVKGVVREITQTLILGESEAKESGGRAEAIRKKAVGKGIQRQ